MPALVAGIHVYNLSGLKDVDGIRNSGQPELRTINAKVGYSRLW
jgi:hypothetical protein